MCPKGQYIYALNARLEENRGIYDDSAMNGLMMACGYLDKKWTFKSSKAIIVYPGYWGTWRGWSAANWGYYACGTRSRY